MTGGVCNFDDFIVGFCDFIFHIGALGETVEVVGTKSEECECGEDDKYVEGSEYFLFDLLFGWCEVDIGE